ncbi:histidine phosphatase family protein [Arthrobacter sp. NPDC090010]|uniref:histidine phosphatase family protein n=1 Tax=Arthrobacter sp. NPDC090010 TaxID=3363942 RepID=UPI0038212A85
MSSTLHLVRHGQTEWNVQHRYQGQTDILLNATGRAQAQEVAESLRTVPLAAVVTSTLGRAHATGRAIADLQRLPLPATDARLMERHFGVAEGLEDDEVKSRFPDRNLIPGRESDEELRSRAFAVLEELAAAFDGEQIAIVTHGGWIAMVLRELVGEAYDYSSITNCSVHTLRWDAATGRVDVVGAVEETALN